MTCAANRIVGFDLSKPKYIKICVGFNTDFSGCIVRANVLSIIILSFTFLKQLL